MSFQVPKQFNILLIGDSCQDVYQYGHVDRMSPEAPVPVFVPTHEERRPGMAANVKRNLEARNRKCQIITNLNWVDYKKTRYVHNESNHHFFRVDTPQTIDLLKLDSMKFDHDVVIISDYDKGLLSKAMISSICENNDLVFLDSKKILGEWASAATFIKINDFEYRRSEPFLSEKLKKKIIRTRGELGCDYNGVNYPVNKSQVRDTSGAGDSFLAALVDCFWTTEDIVASIIAANSAASRIVTTRGVGVI